MGPVLEWTVVRVQDWLREGGSFDMYLAAEAAGEQHQGRLDEIDAERDRHVTALAEFEDQLYTGDFGPGLDRAGASRMAERHRVARDELTAERDALVRRQHAASPAGLAERDADWDDMTVTEQRDWLRAYVDRVIIHPTRKGMAALDLAAIEVVPGKWADGMQVTQPDVPLLVPRAIAAAPRTCDLPGCGGAHRYGPPGEGLCGMHRIRQLRAAGRAAKYGTDPDDWDRSPAGRRGFSGGRGARRGPAPYDGGECSARTPSDCDRPVQAVGLCNMHRQRKDRAARAGHPDDWDRSPRPVTGMAAPPALAGLAWA